jgi:hypothetical protein
MSAKPLVSGRLFYGLLTLCLLLLAVDLFYHRHVVHAFEAWFGFYGFYGFVACVVLVLAARLLRTVLMRREDYYDER